MNGLRLARLVTNEQFDACVHLQQETWNYSAAEQFPRRAFLLADKLGGHVLGAFDGSGTLAAFNVAFPGYRDGISYLHSQMLAVAPAYRNTGVGRALKLWQREIALEQGIDLIEWTYDPLEIKNAFFNLERLGAISRRYVRDFYGPSTSPLQGGLPTDRLYAEWWLQSEHVRRALSRESAEVQPVATVDVPGDIYVWKAAGASEAFTTQTRVREELEAAFERGLIATGYLRLEDGSGRYLLSDNVLSVEVKCTPILSRSA